MKKLNILLLLIHDACISMFANLCGIDIFWILSWSYCLKKKKLELSCTGIVVLLHTAFEPSHFGTEEQRLSSYYIC